MSRIAVPPAAAQPGRVLCAADPERMFPVDESRHAGQATPGERRALVVCDACPLSAECRTVVLGMELLYGVTGGMTAAERRAVRAAERPGVTVVAA